MIRPLSRLSVFLFLVLTYTTIFAFGAALKPEAGLRELERRQATPRDVSVVVNVAPGAHITTSGGTVAFGGHSYLYIAGTRRDPSLRIEIWIDENGAYVGIEQGKEPPVPDATRKVYTVDKTPASNNEILDTTKSSGLALDALNDNGVYRAGPDQAGRLNSCHNYVERLLGKMKITVPAEAVTLWRNWDLWTVESNKEEYPGARPIYKAVLYNTDVNSGEKGSVITPDSVCRPSRKSKRGGVCVSNPTTSKPLNELSLAPKSAEIPQEAMSASTPDDITNTKAADALKGKPDTKVTMIRAGGTLTSFTSVSKEVFSALGVAGTIVGALFIILDFVDHNWVGGAIGAAGLTAGLVAGLTLSGPVGWIVGGALALLMMILPAALTPANNPADRTDVQGILQWTFFADAKHTGNEKCRGGVDGAPGNPDCQVVYGAGTLTLALGLDNFDAIVLLTQFNNGYPMTIPELAKAFYVADEKKKGDGDDKMAVITCHNSKGTTAGRAGTIGADSPKVCNHPTFKINRNMITLPHINKPADQVFNRIVPAPNGDCKLVAYPGDQKFNDLGITITGLPSAIACGLTASINVNGVAVPIDPGNPRNPALGSSADQSTDGQGGAYVAPDPKKAFADINQDKYVCFHKDSDHYCLPPGGYSKQTGMGWEIGQMTGLTLPSGGWGLETHYLKLGAASKGGQQNTKVDNTFTTNVDSGQNNQDFITAIQGVGRLGGSFRITGPTDGPDPICCLFTEPKFGGNVLCLGVGGEELSDQWKNKAKSVSCHGGANIWLYAESYGDVGGALVRGDVEDLINEPYGADGGSFTLNVKAAWVKKGQ